MREIDENAGFAGDSGNPEGSRFESWPRSYEPAEPHDVTARLGSTLAPSESAESRNERDSCGKRDAPAMRACLCECGCGEPAPIATRTQASKGHVKGEPLRFILGHRIRLHAGQLNRDRAIPWRERVTLNARGCLVWQGGTQSRGYGCIGVRGAHVFVWEEQHGAIPTGLTIDHLCEEKLCLNTEHRVRARAERARAQEAAA